MIGFRRGTEELAAIRRSYRGAGDAVERWLFSGNRNPVRQVHVGGKRVVAEGQHVDRDAIAARYRETMHALLAPL